MSETITMEYDVKVDEDRVVDGRVWAADMIRHAYQLLLPYVGECRGCADRLFDIVANEAIGSLHRDAHGVIFHLGPPEEQDAALRVHLERQRAVTAELLGLNATCH